MNDLIPWEIRVSESLRTRVREALASNDVIPYGAINRFIEEALEEKLRTFQKPPAPIKVPRTLTPKPKLEQENVLSDNWKGWERKINLRALTLSPASREFRNAVPRGPNKVDGLPGIGPLNGGDRGEKED